MHLVKKVFKRSKLLTRLQSIMLFSYLNFFSIWNLTKCSFIQQKAHFEHYILGYLIFLEFSKYNGRSKMYRPMISLHLVNLDSYLVVLLGVGSHNFKSEFGRTLMCNDAFTSNNEVMIYHFDVIACTRKRVILHIEWHLFFHTRPPIAAKDHTTEG